MNFGLIGLAVSVGLLILVANIGAQQQSLSWGGYYLDNGTHYLLYEGPRPRPKPAPLHLQRHPNFKNISTNPFINSVSTLNEFPNRIVGGHRVNVCKDCPFLCSVHYEGYFVCGCTLVSRKWCLTAHHCKFGKVGLYSVRCGTTQQKRFGQLRKIRLIVANAGYNPNTMTHDLAMLKFKKPMKYTKCVQKVLLPAPSSKPLPNVLDIWGWGLTSANAVNVQRYALGARVKRVDPKECRKDYASAGVKITPDMVCARASGKDTCSGDSGGPMTHNGVLVGTTSFGIGCARPNYPGVYAKTRSHIEWILNVMRKF